MNCFDTHKLQVSFIVILLSLLSGWRTQVLSQGIIIDHTCTDITKIPESAINKAKTMLHIAYGHTSHGSQIPYGMTGLVSFANNGGKGLSLPTDIFAWNNGGTNGALDLHDGAMGGDVGYYPAWVNNTRSYLGPPNPATGMGTTNPDVNVIMWSWCGQVPDKYAAGTLYTEYLDPMNQLESDYYGVKFVYMTGHVSYWNYWDTINGNQIIRSYCISNNKILYDFADIESYNPNGVYYEFANDNCDYYENTNSNIYLGNWALEWQGSHTENVDWYTCYAAHSYPLNANQKAYAAWWMYTNLAGWDDTSLPVEMIYFDGVRNKNSITIQWGTASEIECYGFHVWRKSENADNFSRITSNSDLIKGHGNSSEEHMYSFADYDVTDYNSYTYKIEELTINGESNFYGLIVIDSNISFFNLSQNYPNPFNPNTTINYYLSKPTKVKIDVFDLLGRNIRILLYKQMPSGSHEIAFTAQDLPSGVYLYSIKAGKFKEIKKMILLR